MATCLFIFPLFFTTTINLISNQGLPGSIKVFVLIFQVVLTIRVRCLLVSHLNLGLRIARIQVSVWVTVTSGVKYLSSTCTAIELPNLWLASSLRSKDLVFRLIPVRLSIIFVNKERFNNSLIKVSQNLFVCHLLFTCAISEWRNVIFLFQSFNFIVSLKLLVMRLVRVVVFSLFMDFLRLTIQ